MYKKLKSKVNTKMILEGIVATIFVILLLGVVNSALLPALANMFGSTAFLGTVNILFALVFFLSGLAIYAKYVGKTGKLNVIELITLALFTMLFASVITIFVPSLVLAYELTVEGIAMFFTTIFISTAIAKQLLKGAKL